MRNMITKKSLTWFGTLAVLGMRIALFAISNLETSNAARIFTFSQDVGASPTPRPPPRQSVAPEATSTATVTEEAIRPCTFDAPLTHTTQTATSLDAYTFSEPQVVLTSTTAIKLFQWLPDGKHWLIRRSMTEVAGEYIETFDLNTGEIKRYAERRSSAGKPIWLPSEQAVAFVDSMPPNYTRVLYLGCGAELPVAELARDLAIPLLSLSSDGQQIIYSANTHGIQSIQFQNPWASNVLVADLPGQDKAGWVYSDAWRADGTMVAIYMYKQGMFYLVDQATKIMCGMDLGQVGSREDLSVSASDMIWSADGRYLATRMAYGDPERFLNLRIIDTLTKEFQDVNFDRRSVHGLDWSPNNNVLLVAVEANPDLSLGSFDNLYLLDAATFDFRPILPKHQFFGAGYNGVLWSPDEMCEWRICMIGVETK